MGASSKGTWIGGTVVIALLIVVATWFLAVSPVLAAASDTRAQAESAEAQNLVLQSQVDQLKADFARLDEYKAELASLQAQVPTDAELAAYLRELDAVAVSHSVTLADVQVQAPQAVTVPVVQTQAAPATTGEAVSTEAAPAPSPSAGAGSQGATDAAAAGAATPAAPVVESVPAGFTAVPLVLTVVGTYDNVALFLDDVQNRTARLFLVASIAGTSQAESEGSGGRPATAVGDLELTITGFTYVLPDALAVPEVVDPAAPSPALPAQVAGKNPLVPVAGD